MKNTWKQLCVACVAMVCSIPMTAHGQTAQPVPAGPATMPTAPTMTSLPDGMSDRVREVIEKRKQLAIDMRRLRNVSYSKFRNAVPNLAVFASPETRKNISKDVIQSVREMMQFDISAMMIGSMGDARDSSLYGAIFTFRENAMYYSTLLQACGDADGVSALSNYLGFPVETITLASEMLTSDDAGQKAKADALIKRLGEKDPADTAGVDAALLILRREMLIDTKLNEPLLESVKAAMVSPAAKLAVNRYEAQMKSKAAMGQIGQPIELKSKLADGSDFTSASLTGKVVVVDFWATWCGPCKAELPRLKALRAQYHDKGMELVSISNDYSKEQLVAYLKANPDMNWPQLFDEESCAENKWHRLTTGFGINGIPALFVIDKKGVLRYTDARKDLETIIPKLLDEQ